MSDTEVVHSVLLKAAALLPNKGTVYFSVPFLEDVIVRARGDIEFISIDKNSNPCYSVADSLATARWLEAYK